MFSKFFIEHPRFAAVVSLVITISGLISLWNLPVEEYPEISPPTLFISATYAGASADVVTQTVAIPIENEINGVEDLLYFSSTSSNSGTYNCQVTFKTGTDSDIALVNLQNAVKRADAQLPSEVTKTGVSVEKRGSDTLGMFVFRTNGASMDLNELANYVDKTLKDDLARVDGVSSTSMMSESEYAMRIWLDPVRMAGMGISTSDVTNAINAQNIQAAPGNVGSEGSSDSVIYKVNVTGRLADPAEFGAIILRSDAASGRVVRLSDVARVELGSSSYTGGTTINGEPAVGLALYRSPDANALATMNRVKAKLAEWEPRLPEGVTVSPAYDPTKFIQTTMEEMVVTILSALLLVILITWAFLQSWRATLIPAAAIPVSLIGTFTVMAALGLSINTLTLFGLILVIGSLVDDAIVVVENTERLIAQGLSPHDAAVKSMQEITGAVIATTLVTVACYLPLAFYGGMVGAIYRQFAVSMCVALSISAVVALTLSPALCALVLRPGDGAADAEQASQGFSAKFFKPFNRFLSASRESYVRGSAWLIRRSLIAAVGMIAAVGVTWFLYGRIPTAFIPSEDKGVIFANIELPADATQNRTEAVMETVLERLRTIPGVQTVMQNVGMSMLSGSGEYAGMAVLDLKPWNERTTPETQLSAIQAEIAKRTQDIAAAEIVSFTPPAIMGLGGTGGASFEICGVGTVDTAHLSDAVNRFKSALGERPETLFAMSSYSADTPQLRFTLDREKAELLQVPASDVYSTMQTLLASYYVNDFTMNGSNYEVIVQADSKYRGSNLSLEEIPTTSSDGNIVPLSALGSLSWEVGPQQITRFNKMTSAGVNAQSAAGVSSGAFYKAIEDTAAASLPKDYHIEWTGLSYQERQNAGQIVTLMGLALLFAYLFLVAQYESWTIPLSVMLSVLFAVMGALMGLELTGGDMSIYTQLGMVMLIGLAGKNAILMVEFAKTARESGLSIIEAAKQGASIRFRAVMMTAWSFLFGVLPLVFATGAGSASRRAIGITTFAGMLSATLIGIFFIPFLFTLFETLREKFHAWRRS